jgi:thioester reductase-like protein
VTQTTLITGGTGFVGTALIGELLKTTSRQLCCVVRENKPGDGRRKLARALEKMGVIPNDARIHVIAGDITRPDLGMADADRDAIIGSVDQIVHSAALIGFLHPASVLEAANVTGTANVIALARRCQAATSNFSRLAFISTAYVAGHRTGIVLENDPVMQNGARNHYEATKAAAEQLVRTAMTDIPATIFRPSIVIGPTREGPAAPGHSLGAALKMLLQYEGASVPVNSRCTVDFVPVDYVVAAISRILDSEEGVGQILHLITGTQYPMTLKDYVGIINEQGKRPPIRTMPLWLFRYILAPLLRLSNSHDAQKALLFAKAYLPYYIENPRFDDSLAREMLAPVGVSVPDPRVAFSRILAAALESRAARSKRKS